ncbi:MAG: DUF5317 domain-containing protein [Anaerolineae bacterium]|nr:DUF5317 domain-containing protein [Anaerolineae bacterium]
MILTLAVMAGLVASLLRASYLRQPLQPPTLRSVWLVLMAFLPQWLAFHWVTTARVLPFMAAAAMLVFSQVLLLGFAWRNRGQPGMVLLGLGVALNLAVIIANGGLMPIFPEVVTRFAPNAGGTWTTGERLWWSKDIVLPATATHLPWLADRFLLPDWLPLRAAYSLGDIFIALGAFRLLWSISGNRQPNPAAAGKQVRATLL